MVPTFHVYQIIGFSLNAELLILPAAHHPVPARPVCLPEPLR